MEGADRLRSDKILPVQECQMHARPIPSQASGQVKHQHAVAGTEFNNASRSGNLMPQCTQHDGMRAHHTVNAAQVRTGANGTRIALGKLVERFRLDAARQVHLGSTRSASIDCQQRAMATESRAE
jgi:hypothetical protein